MLGIIESLLTKFVLGNNLSLNAKDMSYTTAIVANTYYLLTAMAEVSPTVISYVTSRLDLWSLLRPVSSFPEVLNALCNLLQVVTEDAEANFGAYSELVEGMIGDCANVECRSLLSCVLYNITADPGIVNRSIIKVIYEILNLSLDGQESPETINTAFA